MERLGYKTDSILIMSRIHSNDCKQGYVETIMFMPFHTLLQVETIYFSEGRNMVNGTYLMVLEKRQSQKKKKRK